MKRPRLNSRRTLALLAVLLAVLSLLPSAWVQPISRIPRAAVEAAIAPLCDALKSIGDRVRPGKEQVIAIGDEALTRRRYEELIARTRQLELHLREAQVRIGELSQIRQQRPLDQVRLVDASVAAWGVASHTLLISRGQRDGLRTGLVAVDGGSLVGRLSDTASVKSTVHLVTAPRTSLLARIAAPDAVEAPYQPVVQLQSDAEGVFTGRIAADDPVHEGDLAHLADESWPKEAAGFIVGRVVSVQKDPADPTLRRLITIKPLRPLPKLSRLTVMLPLEETSP